MKHVVLHYNKGWANGFRYDIKYWEVWNEPDLGRLFWGGTPEQYFDLYGRIARAIKQADRRALVGGPAISRPNDPRATNPYLDDFLKYVRANRLPLDFYSWHWYATDSNDPLRLRAHRSSRAHAVSIVTASAKRLSMLNEWNYGLHGTAARRHASRGVHHVIPAVHAGRAHRHLGALSRGQPASVRKARRRSRRVTHSSPWAA